MMIGYDWTDVFKVVRMVAGFHIGCVKNWKGAGTEDGDSFHGWFLPSRCGKNGARSACPRLLLQTLLQAESFMDSHGQRDMLGAWARERLGAGGNVWFATLLMSRLGDEMWKVNEGDGGCKARWARIASRNQW